MSGLLRFLGSLRATSARGGGASETGMGESPGRRGLTGFQAHGTPCNSSQSSKTHRSQTGSLRIALAFAMPSLVMMNFSLDYG